MQTSWTISIGDDDGDGIWVAHDHDSTAWGSGETVIDALDSYVSSLKEHAADLLAHEGRLAPPLVEELAMLRRFSIIGTSGG